ncbi:hypothetical protein MAPG_04629 [Magnaporthiopsis poae ATCC 64411]|uniref:Uncharacterized protein n=1 Tax=Magnaporthiopsis poae (strain ATCC 64411 / 73-15) TaxID=644358 RepID=A0A0C4DX89_MAGP6|nr:hypothetical protein MAPG_04629 [Magnaporthiopsis poae ATCC 64411]
MAKLGYRCWGCEQTKEPFHFKIRNSGCEILEYICDACHPSSQAHAEADCIVVCPCLTVPGTLCVCKVEFGADWEEFADAMAKYHQVREARDAQWVQDAQTAKQAHRTRGRRKPRSIM